MICLSASHTYFKFSWTKAQIGDIHYYAKNIIKQKKKLKLISSYIAYKINISNMKLAANFRWWTTKAAPTIWEMGAV